MEEESRAPQDSEKSRMNSRKNGKPEEWYTTKLKENSIIDTQITSKFTATGGNKMNFDTENIDKLKGYNL